MPTGPRHYRVQVLANGELSDYGEECRCLIGEDHADGEESPLSEALSVWDAADIWLSNGMDEDYTFGYSEDELRRAAGME